MRTRVIAILAAVVVAGCSPRQEAFTCSGNPSSPCGSTGTCEANGFCSFPDSTCSSGRRYGDLGGPSGQCVGELPPDTRPDTPPPDARLCFGTAPFTVCFTAQPAGSIDVSMATTFDTVTGTVTGTQLNCSAPTSGGTGYCVIAADTINISAPLRAVGTKPLVLVAATSISVPLAGSIDVGSHRLPAESTGAGADPSAGCNAGTPPSNANNTSGGGAGGSFTGVGGNGGSGGNGGGGNGTRGATITSITTVRGGCPGQDGAGNGKGARGHGGGAVFLIAGNTVTIGGMINAGGEGGAGAIVTADGGGGGGTGGMIGFDATTITVTGTLIANGGGGGEGSSNANGGSGSDASATTAANGGANGSGPGGNGGDGSSGAAGGPGAVGQDGGNGGGGGGGGGGAGLIKAPTGASLTGMISPTATQP